MKLILMPSGFKMIPKLLFMAIMLIISIACLTNNQNLQEGLSRTGYPDYILTILGVAYGSGIMGILQARYSLIREWAFAGYVFAFLGSFGSHLLNQDGLVVTIPTLILLGLCILVYMLDNRAQASKTSA